jgi:hypothetical protein
MLLSRDQFREGVFKRDKHTCVFPGCRKPAEDAHHIIERRLWTTQEEHGGYFMSNGASVCEYHHQYGAETCVVQPQVLRMWVGIPDIKLPSQFDRSLSYDKWGIALRRPSRKHIKYPSTPYLPGGNPDNDNVIASLKAFIEQPLVFTIKMDGSNVCLSHEGVVARNGDNANHPSFGLLKERASNYKIPPGIQIFGEWLFAQHSIAYDADFPVKGYLQIFSVYDQMQELFMGWDAVEYWAKQLGVPTVPVIQSHKVYHNEGELQRAILTMASDVIDAGHEGLVLRTAYPFPYGSFEGYNTTNKTSWNVNAIGKYVREGHNQTDANWGKKIIKNTESTES